LISRRIRSQNTREEEHNGFVDLDGASRGYRIVEKGDAVIKDPASFKTVDNSITLASGYIKSPLHSKTIYFRTTDGYVHRLRGDILLSAHDDDRGRPLREKVDMPIGGRIEVGRRFSYNVIGADTTMLKGKNGKLDVEPTGVRRTRIRLTTSPVTEIVIALSGAHRLSADDPQSTIVKDFERSVSSYSRLSRDAQREFMLLGLRQLGQVDRKEMDRVESRITGIVKDYEGMDDAVLMVVSCAAGRGVDSLKTYLGRMERHHEHILSVVPPKDRDDNTIPEVGATHMFFRSCYDDLGVGVKRR
jgi:hypothetical protein